MADCTALDAANFISSFVSQAGVFSGLPTHYQDALNDASFYCRLREYVIEDQLQGIYQHGAARQLAKVIGVVSSTFVTLWVMVQGFKIINGTMRTPILELGFQAAKIVLILTLISLTLANTPWITEQVTAFQEAIAYFLTGTNTPIDDLIDFNIAATALIDLVVQDVTGKGLGTAATLGGSNTLTAGWLGQGGPAVAAASLLMMARVAIVFGIMLSPLFLFFILFEKTNALFWQWVKYLLSIFFAMAALSIVTVIALQAMSQYGFRVFLSMLVNQMDPGVFRAILVSVITENLSGTDASVDVGGGLTRLAMMGAFFTGLIIAVPTIVMTYFGAAMNMAAQGMNSMARPGGAPGASATSSTTSLQNTVLDQRFEQSQYSAGAYNPSATSGLQAGNQTLQHQAMQQISSMHASPQRLDGGVAMAAQRPSIGMANDAKFQPGPTQSTALAREKVTASAPAVVGTSTATPIMSLRGERSQLDSEAASAPQLVASAATGYQPPNGLPPDRQDTTPVHAMPPPGTRPQAQPVIDVAAKEVSRDMRPMPVRPGSAQFVKRPGPG